VRLSPDSYRESRIFDARVAGALQRCICVAPTARANYLRHKKILGVAHALPLPVLTIRM